MKKDSEQVGISLGVFVHFFDVMVNEPNQTFLLTKEEVIKAFLLA
jgi:hypothetical protein